MPINELESHPFLEYIETEIEKERNYSGLIIGSFPIYSCTDSLDKNLRKIEERFDTKDSVMRFFYGSKKSYFWEYISKAYGQNNPTLYLDKDEIEKRHNLARRRSIEFLNRNNLLMTDVIRNTNRQGYGDEDSNLWITKGITPFITENLSVNRNLPTLLNQFDSVQNLFFTSTGITGKSPFGWFQEIFGNDLKKGRKTIIDGRIWGIDCKIQNRPFNVFLLPTPKARGIHFTDTRRTQMFVNYLQSKDPNFYRIIADVVQKKRSQEQIEKLKNLRKSFLIEAYKQAFIYNNLNFNGYI